MSSSHLKYTIPIAPEGGLCRFWNDKRFSSQPGDDSSKQGPKKFEGFFGDSKTTSFSFDSDWGSNSSVRVRYNSRENRAAVTLAQNHRYFIPQKVAVNIYSLFFPIWFVNINCQIGILLWIWIYFLIQIITGIMFHLANTFPS